ncbi:MAG TPA: DUF5999 family protein [Candidatus Saccharimonadia bacterium]|nr:DUF5999 family protein [Candidatus Saccharimonadia bacterium]
MCQHNPTCPPAEAPNRDQAVVVSDHMGDQGWATRCNGVVTFADNGEILPSGKVLGPPPLDAAWTPKPPPLAASSAA